MSEVCKIESEKIVNGTKMFQESDIVTWNSPLNNLEDGTYMFALASSLKTFRNYDDGEANGNYYCHMASLSNAHGMFKGTNVEMWGSVLDVPHLEIGTRMFEEATIGYGAIGEIASHRTPGRIWLKAPNLMNGSSMFYKTKADTLYLELGNTAGGVNLSDCFSGSTLYCGAVVEGCERFENVSNMFESCKSNRKHDITNPILSQYQGADIWLYFDNDMRAYNVCASQMFAGCTAKTFSVTYNRTSNYYSSYSYSYSFHKGIHEENFFTHLANLMDITNAEMMFYNFSFENSGIGYSFGIRETESTTKRWDKLAKADYMFANCKIHYLTLANELFVGDSMGYGMTASHMLANSIKYYTLGSDSNGNPIG